MTILAAAAVAAQIAAVQPAPDNGDASPTGTIIVTGTRFSGTKAEDSVDPIQVIDRKSIDHAGPPDLMGSLSTLVPSFNTQAVGNDLAQETLQARLRGLSPNHTLVLINGKRRHGTANLSILSSAFQGGASVDLAFIPVGSIKRVEVLLDGAAAQYGSDAIAGVGTSSSTIAPRAVAASLMPANITRAMVKPLALGAMAASGSAAPASST